MAFQTLIEASKSCSNAKVLQIGSGGVGCEVLKNLATSGFKNITVIDLDTIELSNLNRQFLFKTTDIGKPKVSAAAAAVLKMSPDSNITPIQDNIKNPEFDLNWFSNFDLVINALDNLGILNLLIFYLFRFNEYPKKLSKKTFKNLDARKHVNLMCQASNLPLIETGTAGYNGQTTVIKRGFTECFECQPKPIEQKTFPVCTIRNTPSTLVHCVVWAKDFLFNQLFGNEASKETEVPPGDSQSNLNTLKSRYVSEGEDGLEFDKDDDDALRFVAASANIRASVFGIKNESLFQIKAIAGNIIPAIATTNAIIAGLAVTQAIKVVSGQLSSCKTIYYAYGGRRPQLLFKEPLLSPNPKCTICQANYFKLELNFEKNTLQEVIDTITNYLDSIKSNKDESDSFQNSLNESVINSEPDDDVEFSIVEGSSPSESSGLNLKKSPESYYFDPLSPLVADPSHSQKHHLDSESQGNNKL
ncbi:SUMO-activating enzyme subunit 2 [Smittium mucronatum]|uniref:SUMO-activating enzyme subunit 2 n=1 Tax=Smittium mucronatum TaxID=133383 RepID=A0A1R0H4G9_9FUNG|nr:SUMO-activating enzyme subunit 2 [Smittium mucronatum]